MQPDNRKKMTKMLFTAIKVIVTVGGLAYILNKIPFFDAISNWKPSALPWLLFILFLTVVLMAIQANRWRGLLLEDGKKVKFRTFYAYIALGYFFNNLRMKTLVNKLFTVIFPCRTQIVYLFVAIIPCVKAILQINGYVVTAVKHRCSLVNIAYGMLQAADNFLGNA